jgi:GT2 family glycosyltransferase
MMTELTGSQVSSINTIGSPKVAIIILNWNGWKNTVECLESIYQIDYSTYEIVLIDNGSKDGSVEKIKEYADGKIWVESKFYKYNPSDKPIKLIKPGNSLLSNLQFSKELILIENKMNVGFAEGVNIALRLAQKQPAKYILLLNNDIAVDKRFLNELIDSAEKSPEIGIAGPTIYYYDRPTTVDFAGEDLNIWKVKGREYCTKSTTPIEVDKIEGSCMLIRRSLLDKIGLLYPKFWAYWEETDLCFRAKKAGFKVVYLPKSEVWHKVASSLGGENNSIRQYLLNRNRFLFAKRNLSLGNQAKFLVYFFGFEFWLKTAVELKHHKLDSAFTYIRAVLDGLRLFLDPTNKIR